MMLMGVFPPKGIMDAARRPLRVMTGKVRQAKEAMTQQILRPRTLPTNAYFWASSFIR